MEVFFLSQTKRDVWLVFINTYRHACIGIKRNVSYIERFITGYCTMWHTFFFLKLYCFKGIYKLYVTVPVKNEQHIPLFSEDPKLFFSEKER